MGLSFGRISKRLGRTVINLVSDDEEQRTKPRKKLRKAHKTKKKSKSRKKLRKALAKARRRKSRKKLRKAQRSLSKGEESNYVIGQDGKKQWPYDYVSNLVYDRNNSSLLDSLTFEAGWKSSLSSVMPGTRGFDFTQETNGEDYTYSYYTVDDVSMWVIKWIPTRISLRNLVNYNIADNQLIYDAICNHNLLAHKALFS